MNVRNRGERPDKLQEEWGRNEGVAASRSDKKVEGSLEDSDSSHPTRVFPVQIRDSLALLESILPTSVVPCSVLQVLTEAHNFIQQLHAHLSRRFACYRTIHGHNIYNSATFTLSHARCAFVKYLSDVEITVRDMSEREKECFLIQHVTQASTKFFKSLLQSCDQSCPLQTSTQLSPRLTQPLDPLQLLQQDVKAAVPSMPTGSEKSGFKIMDSCQVPHVLQDETHHYLLSTKSQKKAFNTPSPCTPSNARKPKKSRYKATYRTTPILSNTVASSAAACTSRELHKPAVKKGLKFAELPLNTKWNEEVEEIDLSDKENQPVKKRSRFKSLSPHFNITMKEQYRNSETLKIIKSPSPARNTKKSPCSVNSLCPLQDSLLDSDLLGKGDYDKVPKMKLPEERSQHNTNKVWSNSSQLSKPVWKEKTPVNNKRKKCDFRKQVIDTDGDMFNNNLKHLKLEDCSSHYQNVPVLNKPEEKPFRSFCIEKEGMFNFIMENGVKKYSPIRFTTDSEQCTPKSTIKCLPFSSPSSFIAVDSFQNSSSSEDYLPLNTEDVFFSSKNYHYSPLQRDIDSTEICKNSELFCKAESIMEQEKTLQISTIIPQATQMSRKLEDAVATSVRTTTIDQSGTCKKSSNENKAQDQPYVIKFCAHSQTSLNFQNGDKYSGSQTPKQPMIPKWKTCAATPTTFHQPSATLSRDPHSPQAVTPICKHGVTEVLPGPSRLHVLESFTTPEWRPLLYPLCAPKKLRRPTPRQYPPQCRRSLVREFETRATDTIPLLDTPPISPARDDFSLLELESDDDT
ncbi:hypothetical protein Pcinc_011199 [Petrolisthes cinctipes]|uniref:Uncharacterized protein n=1 Tax=Petrolisthes cinctipes TaxID=88211 RepID=A0AAE1KSS8_PETCI|nr:hypothetical protein Pcinc_011199 [Petrolisthes cinctipes]